MGTHERRMAIWNTLCQRKQDTAGHLSAEFHVSLRTIYYDLEYLSLIYPLEVIRGRYHGGIKIADYFTPDKTKLTPVQRDLLLRLFTNLYGNDKLIMLSILKNEQEDSKNALSQRRGHIYCILVARLSFLSQQRTDTERI